jgi:hypothetical protein
MSNRSTRCCCICAKRFEPQPRLGDRQRTCGRADCQKQRRRSNTRTWRAQHPEADDVVCRQARQGDRPAYQAYRRQYWATHPKAREHHAAYMRHWRASRKASATTSVRDAYRDIQVKLPVVNTYMQVIDVREANRVITAKLLSPQELVTVVAA